METKTFRAENMLAALDLVKKELGQDALILSVRKVLNGPAWQVWQKPQVEVVAVAQSGTTEGKKKDKGEIKSQQKKVTGKKVAPVKPPLQPEARDPSPSGSLQGVGNESARQSEVVLGALFSSKNLNSTQEPGEDLIKDPQKSEFLEKLLLQMARSQIEEMPELPETLGQQEKGKKTASNSESPVPAVADPAQAAPVKVEDQDVSGGNKTQLHAILDVLEKHGLDALLIRQIVQTAHEVLALEKLDDKREVLDFVHAQLVSRVKVDASQVKTGVPIFLVGPSGAGKTTTCAKLAVYYSNVQNKKVIWVCADTVRFGAVLEARNYCETIGIPMQPVYSPAELKALLESIRNEFDVILIDMPAFNPMEEMNLQEMGAMITAANARKVWIVAPNTASSEALRLVVNAIKPFKPSGLLFTKLDETTQFSNAINLSFYSQLPITFLGHGCQLIHEITPAKPELLVRALFAERFVV